MTEKLSRTSALASRHTALGSGLEDWNGMGTAWEYSSDANAEHDAIREAAGMFDMSPLKKIRITGPDASAVVDHVHSRDLTRVEPGQSAYGSVLTDSGTVADDAIVFNNGDAGWLFVHGSGQSMEMVAASAEGKDVKFNLDDDLHIVSLQGPKSLDVLNNASSAEVRDLSYFTHTDCVLFDRNVMLSRTGYSGERGYEIFAASSDVGHIWDSILEAGSADGVLPASFTALDKVRVEAALLFYGYDMTADHYPSEVGLGWTISKNGADYRGKAAAIAAMGQERFVAAGICVDSSEMIVGGEKLQAGGVNVGIANSPAFSHRLGKSLALVHLEPQAAVPGTELVVLGEGVAHNAVVERTPFFDPEKTRTHS